MSASEPCPCRYAVPADSQARVTAGEAERPTLTWQQAQVDNMCSAFDAIWAAAEYGDD
jgi:hypothetical protein